MKKLILLFAALSLVSCSDDDSKNDDKYYVDQLIVEADNTIPVILSCGYNDKKQMINIISSTGYTVAMSYEDNRLKTVMGTSVNYTLSYEDGVLSSLTSGGETTPVTYDKSTRKYVIQGTEIFLNQYGDITKSNNVEMSYDVSKKGSISSLGTENNFMIGVLLDLSDVFTNRAITEFDSYQLTNTYNSNGYVTKAVFSEGGPFTTITYSYKKL